MTRASVFRRSCGVLGALVAIAACARGSVQLGKGGRGLPAPGNRPSAGRCGRTGRDCCRPHPCRGPARSRRPRPHPPPPIDARDRSLPDRKRDEDVRRDGCAPARRRRPPPARRRCRPMAARPRPERAVNHAAATAEPHERAVRLRRGPGVGGITIRPSAALLVAAGARRRRDRTPAAVPARDRLVLHQHELRPARARLGEGDRDDARASPAQSPVPASCPGRDLLSPADGSCRQVRARLRRRRGPGCRFRRGSSSTSRRCSARPRGVPARSSRTPTTSPGSSRRCSAAGCFAQTSSKR